MRISAVVGAVLVFLFCIDSIVAITFQVDAHKEECFYEDVKEGVLLGVSFQVTSGGFLDVDCTIYAPDQSVVYSLERESEGRFSFHTRLAGVYRICFGNKMSTVTPKTVAFQLSVNRKRTDSSEVAKTEHLTPISTTISEIQEGLVSIQNEQKLLKLRERAHRNTSDAMNARIVWFNLFEMLVLAVLAVGQIYYLKRFFEVKNVV